MKVHHRGRSPRASTHRKGEPGSHGMSHVEHLAEECLKFPNTALETQLPSCADVDECVPEDNNILHKLQREIDLEFPNTALETQPPRCADVDEYVPEDDTILHKLQREIDCLKEQMIALTAKVDIITCVDLDLGMPQELATMKENIAELRQNARMTLISTPGLGANSGATGDGKTAVDEMMHEEDTADMWDLECQEYHLDLSTWDCAMFIGTGQYQIAGDFYMSLLVLLGVFIQLFFLGITLATLTAEPMTESMVQGLEAWRTIDGHHINYMSSQGLSLVSRVCAGDMTISVGTAQAQYVKLIETYLPDLAASAPSFVDNWFQGWLMCFVAEIIWFCCCISEWMSMCDFANAFLDLPSSCAEFHSIILIENGAVKFSNLGMPHRVLLIVICFVRAVFSVGLLYGGALYITTFLSLSNILLNCVALQYVLTIDELIFDALAPRRVKDMLTSAAPLNMGKRFSYRGIDYFHYMIPLLLCGGWCATWFIRLDPMIKNLQQAHKALCEGSQDFVYYIDPAMVTRIQDSLSSFSVSVDYNISSMQYAGVKEAIIKDNHNISNWNYAVFATLPVPRDLPGLANEIYSNRSFGCHEALDVMYINPQTNEAISPNNVYLMENQWKVWSTYMESFEGISPISDCERDVKALCTNATFVSTRGFFFSVMQMLCPRACGCTTLAEGPWGTYKTCPEACTNKLNQTELLTTPCEDASPQNPQKWAKLKQWAAEFKLHSGGVSEAIVERVFNTSEKLNGCDFLALKHPQLCQKSREHDYFVQPPTGQSYMVKILTYLCPVACGCLSGGTSFIGTAIRQQPGDTCPQTCRCPVPAAGGSPPSLSVAHTTPCSVVWPYIHTINETETFSYPFGVTEECCYVLRLYAQRLRRNEALILDGQLDGGSLRKFGELRKEFCLPCRETCRSALFQAAFPDVPVYGVNFTIYDYWNAKNGWSDPADPAPLCS